MRCRTDGVVGEADQLLDELLARVVRRVRLAGDDELDRRSGCRRSLVSRSGSRSMRVSRLWVGTRRAKPIVSTSGSRMSSTQPSSASAHRAGSHWRTRLRASATTGPAARACGPLGRSQRMVGTRPQVAGSPRSQAPRLRSMSWESNGSTQVGACTPLVIEPIGISVLSKPCHRPRTSPG